MILLLFLFFLSCYKPQIEQEQTSTSKPLNWRNPSLDYPSDSDFPPPKIDAIQSHWDKELVSIFGNSPCTDKIHWKTETREGSIPVNRFGEFSFSLPVHRSRQNLEIDFSCHNSVVSWNKSQKLHRNTTEILQVFSPITWHSSEENSVCFLHGKGAQIEIQSSELGSQLNQKGERIGRGRVSDWTLVSQQRLYRDIQCISFPPKTIESPMEFQIIAQKDGFTRTLRRILFPNPAIWISAPEKIALKEQQSLTFRVESEEDFPLLDIHIQHRSYTEHHTIPLSKNKEVRLPFTATISGLHQITARIGSVQTEAFLWVEQESHSTLFPFSPKILASKYSKPEQWFLPGRRIRLYGAVRYFSFQDSPAVQSRPIQSPGHPVVWQHLQERDQAVLPHP